MAKKEKIRVVKVALTGHSQAGKTVWKQAGLPAWPKKALACRSRGEPSRKRSKEWRKAFGL